MVACLKYLYKDRRGLGTRNGPATGVGYERLPRTHFDRKRRDGREAKRLTECEAAQA
jgi:hypothetical protein